MMLRRFLNLIKTVGLPVLAGLFVADWYSGDLFSAAHRLPVKAGVSFTMLLAWAAFREHQEQKKRMLR
jgi:hypothetical protein